MSSVPEALHAPANPLSPEQLQTLQQLTAGISDAALWWIAGYTAGQAAARGGAPQLKPVAAATARLTVVYGSQTGNAKAAAAALAQQAEAQGVAVRLVNIADYSLAELGRERYLAVAISTQGDGDPPDDARLFLKQLAGARAPKLAELRYTILALGDSSYPKFCEIGRRLDARLAELGAQRLAASADADLDIEAAAAPWRRQTLSAAAEAIGRAAPANVTVLRPVAAPLHRAVRATLLANQRLTARDSEVDVRHIELAVDGLRYEPGDALDVRVSNPPALVDEFLTRTGLSGDANVEHAGERLSLRDWLTRRRELTRLTAPLVDALFATHPGHPLSEIGHALLDSHQVVDVLAAGRIEWDAARWVAALAPLKPRAYSIASAQAGVGDEVHLTVALKRSRGAGIERTGLASGQLAALAEGAEIEVELAPNPRFRLPRDGSRDLIMIGPGTGVAPFRAFLQQRVADGAAGRHWLFFGHRHLQREFLYQTEWLAALKRGQLHKLSVAWSRDGAQRRYVQHLIAEQARELVDWIDAGAHLYVCGDAKRMARDVEQALTEAIARVRGIDAEAAGEELDALAASGRWQRDVY
ncbi:MAG: flavodoxin domain-containing protein [Rhodanobacteraceae bacterium]|nr:flavodoxin domain-containing protein [Rhodanobacteraceae bacterium]